MAKLKGDITPLSGRIFVTDMEFGDVRTASGIYIPSDDRKTVGIHPRWGKIWKMADDVKGYNIGDWVLVQHGRWSRGIEYEQEDGTTITFRRIENKSIMLKSDEKPADVLRGWDPDKQANDPLNQLA